MRSNYRIALDNHLAEKNAEVAPELSEADFFEAFVVDQALKDYDLSWDDIANGNVDGANDGGIDSVYVFVNGSLVDENADLTVYRRDVNLELYVFQSKISPGFSENAVDKIADTLGDLLKLEADIDSLRELYNDRIIEMMRMFVSTWSTLSSKFPSVSAICVYASKADVISPTVEARVPRVLNSVHDNFPEANAEVRFLDCSKLVQLARHPKSEILELRFSEGPWATDSGGAVGLVGLTEYYKFLSSENGTMRNALFEQNVRDYQGSNEVNTSIRETLDQNDEAAFWWLNNGITILCERFDGVKAMTIEDPQIVNGLQTSMEIYNYYSQRDEFEDRRSVLVRVLRPEDSMMRARITKATNSQTAIPAASLRATDPFQGEIESYLLQYGLFYDRRKNYYKNQGKPKALTISITALAQAFMAIAAGRPDDARARPSSLLKGADDYEAVFNSSFPLESYRRALIILERVETYLKDAYPAFKSGDRNNYRFHAAFIATRVVIGFVDVQAIHIAEFDVTKLTNALMAECIEGLIDEFDLLTIQLNATLDRVSKSSQSLEKSRVLALRLIATQV